MVATLPPTSQRVRRNTSQSLNRRIDAGMTQRTRYFERQPEQIDSRLEELDREWDIERVLEANAATLAFSGVPLGAFVDRRLLVIPAVVTGLLLQHALQGWCPPVPFFRRRGVRTQSEIEAERYALRLMRGGFQPDGSAPPYADEVLDTLEGRPAPQHA